MITATYMTFTATRVISTTENAQDLRGRMVSFPSEALIVPASLVEKVLPDKLLVIAGLSGCGKTLGSILVGKKKIHEKPKEGECASNNIVIYTKLTNDKFSSFPTSPNERDEAVKQWPRLIA